MFVFKEVADEETMILTYPLIHKIYKNLEYNTFIENIREMIMRNNYKMLIVYNDDKIVGVVGYWISKMLYCGRYMQLHNLIVADEYRGKGIGKSIINYMENLAIKVNCDKIVLDSYVENKKSHSLYFELDFYIRGFHFMKDLK